MNVLVTGAGGVVGRPLAERCDALGFQVTRAGRADRSPGWFAWDMTRSGAPATSKVDLVLHTAPLWLLPENVRHLSTLGAKRIVCFSSTSALTKRSSKIAVERKLAEALREAEAKVAAETARFDIASTIFRPTMIYGYGRDQNVTVISRFIRKYGFFPVAGAAGGKRQPIHVNDLVDAAVAVIDNTTTHGKTYNLAGGETLTYRDMVERIFQCLGRPARIVQIPAQLYKGMLGIAALLNRQFTGGMAERMNLDLVFDYREARKAFGFDPHGFLEHPERDLPAR